MSLPGYEHKQAVPGLHLIPCDNDSGLQIKDREPRGSDIEPTIGDYLVDFEDAASYRNPAMCAEVYEFVKEMYVPDKTLEVIDVFTASRYTAARAAAAVLTRQWLVEAYVPAEWPELAPAFEAQLHDQSPVVVAKAMQARRAFIAAAPSPLEAQRRIRAVRRLRMPSFAI